MISSKKMWKLLKLLIYAIYFVNSIATRSTIHHDIMSDRSNGLPSAEELFESQTNELKRQTIPSTAGLFRTVRTNAVTYDAHIGRVTAVKRSSEITLSPAAPPRSAHGGQFKPRLYSCLEKLLSGAEMETLKNLPGSFIGDYYELVRIKISKDGSSYNYDIEGDSFVGIRFFDIQFGSAKVKITAVSTSNEITSLDFTISGNVHIGLASVKFEISGNKTHAVYDATIEQASPFDLIDKVFGGDEAITDHMTSFVTDQNLRQIFSKRDIPAIKFIGISSLDEGSQYIIYTQNTFSQHNINLKVFCLISKSKRNRWGVSWFAKVSTEGSLKRIVESLTSITKFPSIPMFEGINVQAVASVSLRDNTLISNPAIEEVLKDVFPEDYKSIIPKGIAVHFSMDLKEKLKECSGLPEDQLKNVSDTSVVSVVIDEKGIHFHPPQESWPVEAVITCLFKAGNDFFTSELGRESTEIQFEKIYYNKTDGGIEVDFEIKKPLSWLSDEFVKINSLKVKAKRENRSETVDFNIEFNKTVDGSTYSGKIARQGTTYDVNLRATILPISKILSLLSFPRIETMKSSFEPVIDFGIKDFLFEGKWNEDSTFRVAGTPYIYGFDKVSFEAVLWKRGNTRSIAFGIKFDKISLNDIIKTITGTDTKAGSWLSQIDCVIAVASNTEGMADNINAVANKKKGTARNRREVNADNFAEYENQKYKGYRKTSNTRLGRSSQRHNNRGQNTNNGGNSGGHPATNPGRRPAANAGRGPSANSAGSPAANPTESPSANSAGSPGESSEEEKEVQKMTFIHDAMKSITVVEGLMVRAVFTIPSNPEECKGDEVCSYLNDKVAKPTEQSQDTKLTIVGQFGKTGLQYKVNLKADLETDIQIMDNVALYFTKACLEIDISGVNSSVKISATLEYRIQPQTIEFTGTIAANSNQLKIEFAIKGIWNKPFGVEWMAFGDLAVSAVFEFKTPSLLLGFGGKLQLGKIGTEDCIQIEVYFGFNVNLPTSSYIYGNVTSITIEKISKAFEVDISSSEAVKATGFPDGLVFSYNGGITAQKVEKFDITVKPGLYLKGKINILGYSIDGELELNQGKLTIYMELDPISFGDDYIIIQRNRDDTANGPILNAIIDRSAASMAIDFKIVGFIFVVGIGVQVEIKVNNTNFHMHIEGKMFDAITAKIDIKATYGNDLKNSNFQFVGCLSTDLHALRAKIAEFLRVIKRKAEELKAKVDMVKALIDTKTEQISERIKNRKMLAQQKQTRALEEVADMRRVAANNQDDCDTVCPKGCRTSLIWKKECIRVFGWWIGCPYLDNCAYQGRSALCLAGCHIKNAAVAVVDWSKEVAFKIKNAFIQLQTFVINAVDSITSFAANLASKALEIFNGVVNAVGNLAEIAADFVESSDNFLKINHVCLKGGVSSGKSACVGVDVDMRLFSYSIIFSKDFCVGQNFLDNVAKSSSAKKYGTAEDIEERGKEFQGEVDELDKQKSEIEEKERKLISEADKSEDEIEERSSIPGRPNWHKRKHNFNMTMLNSTVISEFQKSAPTIDDMRKNEDNIVTFDGDHSIIDAFFKENTDKSDCSQTRSVVNKYHEITRGAKHVTTNAEEQRNNFEREKRLYNMELEYMKKDVERAEISPNITFAERQELHFWYQNAEAKVDYWIDDVSRKLETLDGKVMKTYKRQLDTIVGKHAKKNTIEFMGTLAVKGESLIRRSGIPGVEADKRSEVLKEIHEGLRDMLENPGKPMPATRRSLDEILDNIHQLKSHHTDCK